MKKIRLDLRQRLSGLVTRARTFFEREQSIHVVQFSKLDESFFRHHLERWPRFHQLAAQGKEQYPIFEDFLTDLFFALYLYDPLYRGAEQVRPTHQANVVLMAQTQMLPVWANARAHSALNRLNTMLGLVFVAEALLENIPEEAKQSARAAQEASEGSEALKQDLQELLDHAETALAEDDGEGAEAVADGLEEMLGALGDQPGSEIDQDAARRMMRNALDKATNEMGELESAMKHWGVDPGELQHLPIEQVMALYDKMRGIPHFKDFTDEIGRQRDEAQDAARQLGAKEAAEIVDVTTGRSLSELLPNERVSLVAPELEAVFWAKFAQEGLLTWEYAGREAAAKGPFIICLDVSGSTWGSCERWGKAFALASLDLASKQGRDVAIIFFDADVRDDGVFIVPRGKADLETKVAIASYYTGGGTDFVKPLTIAMNTIQDATSGWQEADIVLATDGACPTDAAFVSQYRAMSQSLGVRTHGVLLDGSPQWLDYLKPICDRVVSIKSLQDSPRALFTAIAS